MIACPGAWRNFEDIEENLSLSEIEQLLDASRRDKWEQNKFLAAIKGIKIDSYDELTGGDLPTGDDIRRQVEAEARGMSEEELEFEEIGFQIIQEDD